MSDTAYESGPRAVYGRARSPVNAPLYDVHGAGRVRLVIQRAQALAAGLKPALKARWPRVVDRVRPRQGAPTPQPRVVVFASP